MDARREARGGAEVAGVRLARLVHLARASTERSIRRAGLRGRDLMIIVAPAKTPRVVHRCVFAMPVLPDFGATYQWLRELRQWHGERMVAVHVRIPDDELVLVGRYGEPHDERTSAAAAKQVAAKPAGAEIIVPRAIARSEIVAIREMTQLVGWTDRPETDAKLRMDCVCPVCLPRGVPDRVRRLNGAYRRGLDAYRRATTAAAKLDALSRIATVLGEAKGRLDEAPLLRIARTPDPEVRQRAAAVLGLGRWSRVEAALTKLALGDGDPSVRSRAVGAMLESGGPIRAARVLAGAPERENEVLVNVLGDQWPTFAVASALEIVARRHAERLSEKVSRVARGLLSDDVPDARAKALLETLSSGLKRR